MDKVIGWLFDPASVGGQPANEQFHFYVPWLIFCVLGLLLPFYYDREARKRFFANHRLHRYLLDRAVAQLWPIALVGLILLGARVAEMSIVALRGIRYAWGIWLVVYLGYWAYYLTFKYPGHRRAYRAEVIRKQYKPEPRRRAARAVSR